MKEELGEDKASKGIVCYLNREIGWGVGREGFVYQFISVFCEDLGFLDVIKVLKI